MGDAGFFMERGRELPDCYLIPFPLFMFRVEGGDDGRSGTCFQSRMPLYLMGR